MDLKAETRHVTGNSPARDLRRSGQIPAVLYGQAVEPTNLSIPVKALEDALKNASGQVFLNLSVADAPPTPVLLKELQRHPVSGAFIHADFLRVDMSRTIRVMVPIVAKGKCIGVEMGGMLQIIRRQVEVSCLPDRIPENIEIDITNLKMGESVHVEDIDLGEEIDIPHEVNFTILTVLTGRKKGEEVEGAEGAEGAPAGEAAAAE